GVLAMLLGRGLGRWPLALMCAAAGFVFGAWMDLFTLLSFAAERSAGSYLAVAGVSLPFNVAHALGNLVLCLAFGPGFVRMLARFRRRLEVRWIPATQFTAGAGLLLVLLALSLQVQPSPAGAAADAGADAAADAGALRYLARAQN